MAKSKYVAPYTVVGLSPVTYFIKHRKEVAEIIKEIDELAKAAVWLSSSHSPVKLLVLTEGALQGFRDEVFDLPAEEYIRDIALDIDGPEIRLIKEMAVKYDVFLAFQARTTHPEFPGRFFNENILLDPKGEIILRHYKNSVLYPCEHSTTPHDVLDKWTELYGDGLDAFFPVAKTEIGNIGFAMAMEGSYPEYVRGVAMNGAEVLIRMCLPQPHSAQFEIQNRAHALNNTMFVIGNQGGIGKMERSDVPIDVMGGGSHVVNYKGEIQHQKSSGHRSFFASEINIEGLREFRITSPVMSWIKDLRTEIISLIYKDTILEANMNAEKTAYNTPEYESKVLNKQVKLMIDRGVFTPPAEENWRDRVVGEKS